MDIRLEIELRKIYPSFFPQENGNFLFSPSIATGDGWYPILACLLAELAALATFHRHAFRAEQIKEKFGVLRAYVASEGSDDPTVYVLSNLLIDWATEQSRHYCDVCGRAGTLSNGRTWYRTRCKTHVNVRSDSTPQRINAILALPLPALDLSQLTPLSRIRFSRGNTVDESRAHLSLVRYRSLPRYTEARLSDIEIVDDRGWYDNVEAAIDAGRAIGSRSYRCDTMDE